MTWTWQHFSSVVPFRHQPLFFARSDLSDYTVVAQITVLQILVAENHFEGLCTPNACPLGASQRCVYWSDVSVRHRLQNMCHLLAEELSDWLLGLADGMWSQSWPKLALLARMKLVFKKKKSFSCVQANSTFPQFGFISKCEKKSDISNNNCKGFFKPATTVYGFTLSLLTALMPLMTICP